LNTDEPFLPKEDHSFFSNFLEDKKESNIKPDSKLKKIGSKVCSTTAPQKVFGEGTTLLFKEKLKRSQSKSYNFVKTKKVEFMYYQYLYNTFMQCLFALISVFTSILAYEIEFNNHTQNKRNFSFREDVALWFAFITSVGLWGTIIYEFYFDAEINAINKNLPENIWKREKNNLISLFLTLLVFTFHPNPLFKKYSITIYNDKYNFAAEHSINSIFTVFCLLRMWYFVKFYLVYSEYYTPRTQRVCQMNNFDTSLTFSMKASMIKTPYHVYLLLFSILLLQVSK